MASSSVDYGGRDYVKRKMPMVGLGTYQVRSEDVLRSIIDAALGCGYRFIDTAQCYGNEPAIGRLLKQLLPKHNLKREDIFITSKVSPANQGRVPAAKSIDKTLANLQIDYLDLMLIHWPGTSKLKVDDSRNAELRKETYEVMEESYRSGKLRSIGVSNYEVEHMEELVQHASVFPAVNQVEFHPHFHRESIMEFCADNDIHMQAYSSLGSPQYRDTLFSDPQISRLAEKYKVSVAIFLLAWPISLGYSVLPRSSKPTHVCENFLCSTVNVSKHDAKILLQNNIEQKQCWDSSNVR